MDTTDRQLVALHCTVWKAKRIVFRYKAGRWEVFESLRPWDIREALKVSLERIDDAFPGGLAKAAELDDANWQASKRRTRRYIAESPDLIYIDSPHLQAQLETVRGFYVPTNIPWRDVPGILRLVCKAAGIEYGSLANITM
jgi:hypothetical protein